MFRETLAKMNQEQVDWNSADAVQSSFETQSMMARIKDIFRKRTAITNFERLVNAIIPQDVNDDSDMSDSEGEHGSKTLVEALRCFERPSIKGLKLEL